MRSTSKSHLEEALGKVLARVQKPSRYLGNEYGRVVKDPSAVRLRFALAFPDVYEIAQSHLGLQILYDILNRRPDIYAERVYAPWHDMEQELRKLQLPLVSLETFTPLAEFHIVGFTLQYELTYTNLLCMLELSGIPLRSSQRTERHPLVVAGGPCAFNPEPLADFLDAVLLGDGEEAVLEICDTYLDWQGQGNRSDLLEALAQIRGVYVPSFYRPRYNPRGELEGIEVTNRHAPDRVRKRILADLNAAPLRQTFVIPSTQIVHDRPAIEVMRGCVKGCRFCQAGYIYRPLRERDPRRVLAEAFAGVRHTGSEELSLLSLSTGDYSCINPVLGALMQELEKQRVAVSLPSTRVDALAPNLLEQIRRVRKTGFTLAPEAGSQRLRDMIQKEYTEAELLEAARLIFALGWRHLKLYFMIGLPTETEEDLEAIVELCSRVRSMAPRGSEVVASVSNFVPKAHTPFQWLQQVPEEELSNRQEFLRSRFAQRGVAFRYHDARLSLLEGVFSRGDRRLANTLVHAFRAGCRFDGWHEQCRFDLWREAFSATGIHVAWELRRRRLDEPLPWDHLDCGVSKEFLRRELSKAFEGTLTPDCSVQRCTYCGACDFKEIRNVDFHLFGAKAAEHRGHMVDHWASAVVDPHGPPYGWEPRGWKKVHAPELLHESWQHADLALPEADNRRNLAVVAQPTGELVLGNAEEWIEAEGEHRLSLPRPTGTALDRRYIRYRIRYQKRGRAKFLGSIELTNAFYRALRLSGLPVVFTNGHHALPRVVFGPATPFGVESDAEFCEVFLDTRVPIPRIQSALNPFLPAGVAVLEVWEISERAPSLSESIQGFEYEFDLSGVVDQLDRAALETRISETMNARELWAPVKNRNGVRQRNLRENIVSLQLDKNVLRAVVRHTQAGSIRPRQLIQLCLPFLDHASHEIPIEKIATYFREPPQLGSQLPS